MSQAGRDRPRRRVRASTRAAARPPPTAPATTTPARSRTPRGRRAASTATRSPSTARTTWVTVNQPALARPHDRDDARGLGQPERRRRRRRRCCARGERPGDGVYGALLDHIAGRTSRTSARCSITTLPGLPVGALGRAARGRTWPRRTTAATLRLYVNGTQVATSATPGSIQKLEPPLRIGGDAIWGEYFNGLIDKVRVYDRALSAGRDPGRHVRRVTPDTMPPTVTPTTPAPGAAGVNVGTVADREVQRGDARELDHGDDVPAQGRVATPRRSNGLVRPATNDGDADAAGGARGTARPTPATVKGGAGGVTDVAGNALAADASWSFSTEASPPPMLVITSTANPFGALPGRDPARPRASTPSRRSTSHSSHLPVLSYFDVVLLGDGDAQRRRRSPRSRGWVNGGGNLVAMRPDKQLAGLLGLTSSARRWRTPT